jgi:hypothetical protein
VVQLRHSRYSPRPNPSTHITGARRLDFRPRSRRTAERRSSARGAGYNTGAAAAYPVTGPPRLLPRRHRIRPLSQLRPRQRVGVKAGSSRPCMQPSHGLPGVQANGGRGLEAVLSASNGQRQLVRTLLTVRRKPKCLRGRVRSLRREAQRWNTLRLLEIKVVKLVSSDAPATARSANIMKRLVVLSCSSRLRRDESRRGRIQSLWQGPRHARGVRSCAGSSSLLRSTWWHSRSSPTSQPLARSSSTLLFDPTKRPKSHGCGTSWRPEGSSRML